MSARRRSGRGKGGGGNAGNPNGGGAPSGGGGGGKAKAKAKKAVDFWEVPGTAPADLAAAVHVPDDPTVLVRSLGTPSLPGQGANAEHYFTAVYDKASHVAYALAVANGLLADEGDPVDASNGDADAAEASPSDEAVADA
ncbi:MAG: hypothetical protein JNK12_17310 [Acidimicrobiales bacterium]|nr:hypothetical protein [Acidimicrobiales bacterium]